MHVAAQTNEFRFVDGFCNERRSRALRLKPDSRQRRQDNKDGRKPQRRERWDLLHLNHPSTNIAAKISHKLMKVTEGCPRDHDNNFVKQSPSPM
jgi:hypothetical protein